MNEKARYKGYAIKFPRKNGKFSKEDTKSRNAVKTPKMTDCTEQQTGC